LQSSNFDFNLAKTDGSDLRFSKTNGVSLPFEIEQWDAVNREAEIWVKVDTIYGNDSTHSIAMYWGNSNATDNSNSSNVFDTADNVTAVWHLNKNCNDATIDKHDGLENSARDTSGLIGHCKKFNGSDSIKVAGLLGSPTSITLSAWAQLDSTPASGNEIISIGDVALIREDYTLDSLGTDAIIHLSDNTVFYNVPSGKFLKKTGWHFIAFTLDQNTFTQTLYIDGEKAGTRTDLNTPLNYNGMGQNTYIGKHGNGKNDFGFIGRIDEVRVYRAAMSPDYIKLSFMNQKANEALIVFK
jgi:hypothetical protein